MQLIVDGSLSTSLNWPKGPWMAQSAHAAIAAIHISSSSPNTQAYLSPENLGSMHKVVLQTPAEGKHKLSLQELAQRLDAARTEQGQAEGEEFPQHYLWIEQPEGIATCLAIAPNRKPAALKKVLRQCTLLKD